MSTQLPNGYAGDVSAADAYSMLESDKSAVLVDVRSKAEWTYVGVPDLSEIGKETIFVEWQEYPAMKVAADFAPHLLELLRARGVSAAAPLLFLCRSGVRSRAAAIALTQAGQEHCYNIAQGFEGPLDDKQKRGAVDGWKARGLPWAQS
ncbi:rhodanese-like domain-containing protein [Methylocapsa sp. S129]|uniref:rhodanese-like domain-containing protein n=1 Tax=Methylocapsa sp. S129 TaxID=1641869 RepID=UPI0015766C2B|nr:rhodanese-like domain-containing protein [Methylocapsa sp. S129]